MERKRAPVFVVGCHRSGTSLLYDTLLSSGGFAVFRASSFAYETLVPRFGDLGDLKNRQAMMNLWLRTKPFRRSGLDAEHIKAKVLAECRSGGDFLRIVMGEISRSQDATRWANYGPDCVHHIPQIKREIPEALIIHILRDGRDIALSLTKMGGIRPLPWHKPRNIYSTALFWEWTVRAGKRNGAMVPGDYIEVHYEDLVAKPRETLMRLSAFLDHDLDYEHIQRVGIGRVSDPNSSFKPETQALSFNPIGRWKERLSIEEICVLEGLIGDCLQEFGYPLTTSSPRPGLPLPVRVMRTVYPRLFATKLWLKEKTPLGRFASTRYLELAGQPG
jgi:sulfotransferase family protein